MISATGSLATHSRIIVMLLITVALLGCGKSADERAKEDAKIAADAAAAAQRELDADQAKLRGIISSRPKAARMGL
jgi:hypothetical protein